MHVVNYNSNPVFWGSIQECRNYLIMKARVIANTDQKLYEQYVSDIVYDGVLSAPEKKYEIKANTGN